MKGYFTTKVVFANHVLRGPDVDSVLALLESK